MKAPVKAAHELLAEHVRRHARDRRSPSLRSVAKALEFSPSFLSEVLRGKKSIPVKRIDRIARFFELDEAAETSLRKAVAREKLSDGMSRLGLEEGAVAAPLAASAIEEFEDGGSEAAQLLEHWSFPAILDLATCADFKDDIGWIAARLGLSRGAAAFAFGRLLELGFLKKRADGTYEKQTRLIRYPTRRSDPRVRALHAQTLRKAIQTLADETDDEAFARRLISGITMAVDPKRIPQAREILSEALHRATQVLTDGECTEVFQLNCQLFPLTKKIPVR